MRISRFEYLPYKLWTCYRKTESAWCNSSKKQIALHMRVMSISSIIPIVRDSHLFNGNDLSRQNKKGHTDRDTTGFKSPDRRSFSIWSRSFSCSTIACHCYCASHVYFRLHYFRLGCSLCERGRSYVLKANKIKIRMALFSRSNVGSFREQEKSGLDVAINPEGPPRLLKSLSNAVLSRNFCQ